MSFGERRFGYMKTHRETWEDPRRSREFLQYPNKTSSPHTLAANSSIKISASISTPQKRVVTPPPPTKPHPEHALQYIDSGDTRHLNYQVHQQNMSCFTPPPPPRWLITAADNRSKHRTSFEQRREILQEEEFKRNYASSAPRNQFPSPFFRLNNSQEPINIQSNRAVNKKMKPPLPSLTRADTNTSDMVSRQLREWAADYAGMVVKEHTKELREELDNSRKEIDRLMQKCSILEDKKVDMVMRGYKGDDRKSYSNVSASILSYFDVLTMNGVVCIIKTVRNQRQRYPSASNPLLGKMDAAGVRAGLLNSQSVTTTCTTSEDVKVGSVTVLFGEGRLVLAPMPEDEVEGDSPMYTAIPRTSIMMKDVVEDVSFVDGSLGDTGGVKVLEGRSHHLKNYPLRSSISCTAILLRKEPTSTSEYAYIGDNQKGQVPQQIIKEEDNEVTIFIQGPSEEASVVLYKAVQQLWNECGERHSRELSPSFSVSPLRTMTNGNTCNTPSPSSSIIPPPLPATSPEMHHTLSGAADMIMHVEVRPSSSPQRDKTTTREHDVIINPDDNTSADHLRDGYEKIDVEENRLLAEVDRLTKGAEAKVDLGFGGLTISGDSHFEYEKNVRKRRAAYDEEPPFLYSPHMQSRLTCTYSSSRSPPRLRGHTGHTHIRSYEEDQYISKAWDRLFGASGGPSKTKYHPSKLPPARNNNMTVGSNPVPSLSADDAAYVVGLGSQDRLNYFSVSLDRRDTMPPPPRSDKNVKKLPSVAESDAVSRGNIPDSESSDVLPL